MMRALLLCAVLLIAAPLAWADTEAGLAAYDRGDYAAALQELKPAAESGDAAAQATYGVMLVQGRGIAPDPAAGVAWLRKSAEQGDARGQFNLGVAWESGQAGAADPKQAAEWYRKSAEQGFSKAQFNLGHLLIEGKGLPPDKAAGAEWVRKAAEQDMVEATDYFGMLNMIGEGVEQNILAARFWLRRSMELGHPEGDDHLGRVDNGIRKMEAAGVPKTEGGDGSSMERAIQLPDAKTETDGVTAEHRVIRTYFPAWTWTSQGLVNDPSLGIYDEITLTGPGGAKRIIYFDIANWFGKIE